MGRNRRPAKAYRPRSVNPLAHLVAIQGASLIARDDRLAWISKVHDALAAVRTGSASKDHWTIIFDVVNLLEEFCRMRICRDEHGLVRDAQCAAQSILERQAATGVRAARAAELAALGDALTGYADVMAAVTHAQLFECQERIEARHKHRRDIVFIKPPPPHAKPLL